MKQIDFDVAIIGYGPVGATLANLLGQFGWRTAIFEKEQQIFPVPRAVHIDDEALRILQSAGVMERVEPSLGGYPKKRQYRNAKGEVFFETFRNDASPFGYPSNTYFHQPLMEEGLRKGVSRFEHVVVHLGCVVTGLTQNDEHVTLTVRDADSGQERLVTARYVVGCDGARSTVRKQLGIGFHDLKFEQPWLVTDFYLKSGVTLETLGLPYAHMQLCNPQQPMSFIPSGVQQHYRWEFMLVEGQTKEQCEQPEHVQKMLSMVVDTNKIELVRAVVYTFHSLIAEPWRVGRIFIAGDAAHQMPPFAGQGMCSGLRDVHNLSWKLHLVLSGAASAGLLERYEEERIPHVTRMTRGTMFLGNLVQTRSRLKALVRDLLFRTVLKIPFLFGRIAHFALRSPNIKTGVLGGTIKNVAGMYFIQPTVTQINDDRDERGEPLLLDEILGTGFAILALNRDPQRAVQVAGSTLGSSLPIRFVMIATTSDRPATISADTVVVRDHEGKLGAWFSEHKADYVVIRPDRYLFGAYTQKTIHHLVEELTTGLFLTD